MALHQNNDNIPKPLDNLNSQINYRNVTNDRFWINENIENYNQSKQSVNLTAVKHDHPLIASAVDNIGPKTNALCGDESILVASLPPIEPQTFSQTAQWLDSTDLNGNRKAICLPFGYCYDDEKIPQQMLFNQNDVKTTLFDSNEWFSENTDLSPTADPFYTGVNNYPYLGDDSFNIENVFQVDKADLKTGPTLAELNANDWDALDLDDLLASAQMSNRSRFGTIDPFRANTGIQSNLPSMDCEYDSKLQENIDYLSSLLHSSKNQPIVTQPTTQTTVSSDVKPLTSSLALNPNPTVKQEVLQNTATALKPNPYQQSPISVNNKIMSNDSPVSTTTVLSSLLGAQPKKQQNLLSTEKSQLQTSSALISPNKLVANIAEEHKALTRVRNNSISTEYSASSHDEGFASQPEDSDNEDEDMSSDDESFYGDYDASDLLGASTSDDVNNKWSLNMGRSRKGGERRYFWQYNVQSKGPKGTRIVSVDNHEDPHIFSEINDPVFAPDCQVEGVKHSGKARRGDGNDLTPNPKKLLMIGLELKKLSKIINDLTPVAEVPVSSRGKSRKEKNKLASRACRLKKKAQHEANKIKLYGLQLEHKKIMYLLAEVKKLIKSYNDNNKSGEMSATQALERLLKTKAPSVVVAGKTSEFVNHILDNVSAGISNGGLDKI